MPIGLQASEALEGVTTTATTVTYTISGLEMTTASPPVANGYKVSVQGQLAASAGVLYSPSAVTFIISSMHFFNTGGTVQTVLLYIAGTAGSNQIASLAIPPGGWASYEAGGGPPWTIYSSSGLLVGTSGAPGGLGTVDQSTVAMTASTRVMVPGTKVGPLATGSLFVGQRFRFKINMLKTAAGTATWTAIVAIGTNGTTSDTAVATFTSGTNTAAIDKAMLEVEVLITALGSGTSATAKCEAFYVNSLTSVTGFGDLTMIPGATAGFDSTVSGPFLHVDITQGASASVTAIGSAERLV